VATGLQVYGLWQLGGFQRQERVWRNALDRSIVLGFVNFGLSPFIYWWSRIPDNGFFLAMVILLAISGLLFLASVNFVLQRLGAMLPDEALRIETNQFTTFNLNLILAAFVVGGISALLSQPRILPLWLRSLGGAMERQTPPFWLQNAALIALHFGPWFLLLLILLPLAMTMALLWKTKEVIMENVFGTQE